MDAALLTTDAFWADPAPLSFDAVDVPAGLDGHVLFATSGSSGIPKWVALTKDALRVSAAAVNRHLQVTETSCWGLALPIHHVGGFGVTARAHEAGCRFEQFTPHWEPMLFRDWADKFEISHTSLVPTQVHDLVRANCLAPQSLRAVVVGGGSLDQRTGQAARALGWPVLASYGMTEAASQIATQGLEVLEMPYQTAPLPLLPHWQARSRMLRQRTGSGRSSHYSCETVLDSAPYGPDGFLQISGPALFSGYIIDGVFHPRESDWHSTSDRVMLDDRGLTPLGRADSVVKILGELVDPEAIECQIVAAANGLAVASFAIIAIPDDRAGNLLVPVFESRELLEYAAPALNAYSAGAPGYRRLQPAIVIENFPRSELGKVRRRELEAICSRELTRRHAPPA